MDLLNRILSLEAPPGMKLQSADLSLRGVFPIWLALLLLAVGIVAAVGFYWREQAPLKPGRRAALMVLRVAVIGFIVLLLLRPVLVAEFHGERPQGTVVLLDNSQSLKQADRRVAAADKLRVAIAQGLVPATTAITDSKALADIPAKTLARPERAEVVKLVLTNGDLKLLDSLQRHGPSRHYTFGQQLRRVKDDPGAVPTPAVDRLLADFQAADARTALADSINDILLGKDGDLPGAIVVITDGNDNASKLPLDEVAIECARLKVPLHIYGVGTAEGGTLLFKDVLAPETIFYEDTVSVPVRWRSRGLKQGTAVITLKMGDKVVATRELPVREGEDFRETLTFTPQKKGDEREEKSNLTATIQLKGNDDYKDEITRPVQVIDRKVKVLVVENTPRWEFKFLMPALLRDRRVEASFILINSDERLAAAGPPFLPAFPARDKLFAYDLLILGDIPATWFDTDRVNAIQDFVKEGGGLVMIAGHNHAPASFSTTTLAEVLPVEFLPTKHTIDPEARPQAWQPVLTTAGERADMMMLADTAEDNVKTWKALPGWYWHYPVTKLRPGATALLVHPTAKAADQPMPLVATHYYGKGQVVFMGVEETWRWRANAMDKFFPRFWGQVIYQLGLPHLLGNAKRTQVALEQAEAILGNTGYVRVKLFDAEFRPLKDDKVTANLEYLDSKGADRSRQVTLDAVPGQPGEYRAPLAFDAAGRYELRVNGPEPTVLPYRVNLPPRHEQEALGLAEDSLKQAAKISGGKFYREEDLHRLSADMETKRVGFTQRQEILLWGPLAMTLFVLLITAEWLVRKFSNLS